MLRCVLATATFFAGGVASAQTTDDRLRVFLDCDVDGCDREFIVNEHSYAIWTQDRLDADVHLLVTRLETGSGGSSYTVLFISQRRLAPDVDTLTTTVPPNSSDDMQRRAIARIINLGLVADAARFVGPDRFRLSYEPEREGGVQPPMSDRWNLWVYRLGVSGNGSAESRSSEYELSAEFNASRVTERWKLLLDAEQEYEGEQFELSDGRKRQFILRSIDANARIVRSLTQHWSVGSMLNSGMSEFNNQDAFAGVDFSAEYNLFPWSEATSRQLIALASIGGRYFDYHERTIFGREQELRPVAQAIIAGESRQPWGSVDGSLRYRQFLHDSRRYNLSFFMRSEFRITRGLSVDLSAEAEKVQDQLYLPRGEASDDEVLTRQRALATAYRLSASVGLSFTFGSIYNTIVNPRLDRMND